MNYQLWGAVAVIVAGYMFQNSRFGDLKDSINKRVDDINKRIDDLKSYMDFRFKALEDRMKSLEDRMDRLEKSLIGSGR